MYGIDWLEAIEHVSLVYFLTDPNIPTAYSYTSTQLLKQSAHFIYENILVISTHISSSYYYTIFIIYVVDVSPVLLFLNIGYFVA